MKLLFFVSTLFLLASTANAQSVSASITGGAVTRGSKARGVVTMSIPAGLHVNSNRPSSQYAIATTVKISTSGATTSAVTYPRGANRKFDFSEDSINVYEGRVRFPFSLTVPKTFSGNVVRLRATVRYQACTNEVCYPPKTKDITFTAKVL
jgi:DsbC/DsbD-like thiol-disulfide interchange protein